MNKMRDTTFPSWLVQNLIIGIYNREWRRQESAPKPVNARNQSWGRTCTRVVNQLKDRYRVFNENQTLDCEWQNLITYQINKMYKRYDPVYLWGICEFRILELINSLDFGRDNFRTPLFQFKAVELVADLNKRLNNSRPKLKRTMACTWTDLIGNASKRLAQPVKDAGTEYEWELCIRYNRDKFNKLSGYMSWNNHIFQNQKKIQKWIWSRLGRDGNNIKNIKDNKDYR